MEQLRNILAKKQWIAIPLGMIAGILVLGTTLCCQKIVKNIVEQADQETTLVCEPTIEAIPSVYQVSIERNSYFIKMLPSVGESESEDVTKVSCFPSPAKVFRILFDHIIAPNSP